MAMTMKNFESALMGATTPAGSAKTVVMTLASTKKRMKNGKIFLMSNDPAARPSPQPASATRFAARTCRNARASVMGMIARVRVSLTMVAWSSAFEPGCMPSQAAAAAVTEDVSFTAVPANRPKPSLLMPSIPPSVGNTSAAMMLNRKMTLMAWAISSSSASMTGAVAAMADPPQMEEPTPTSVEILVGIRMTRCST